ncbi:MAG: helix-turn-helix transcriptional regulator [Geobacter sp.]|nr:helix-turn-helix transcriptional regulator [Geobacter sp.]
MARERGSGKTPERVVKLLVDEVDAKSILAIHKATGIGLAAIGRYLKGIGEPTTATLEKLAKYFNVTVAWLRGEDIASSKTAGDFVKFVNNLHEASPDTSLEKLLLGYKTEIPLENIDELEKEALGEAKAIMDKLGVNQKEALSILIWLRLGMIEKLALHQVGKP